MSKRDYYEVLGVSKTATEAEIKQAFRRLAMKLHPDRCPDDKAAEEKFKEAKEACEVLTDSHKRAIYDRHGHAGLDASRQQGGGGFNPHDMFSQAFGEVFGDLFGGRRRNADPNQPYRGADLQYSLEIDLEQAVFGDEIDIDFESLGECETCQGSGAAKGSKPETCGTCGGHGQVRVSQGPFSLQQTCPHCRGRGQVVKQPCDNCYGQGRIRHPRKVAVKVPAGVDNGDRIRMSGEGEAGRNGGPAGDLYVEIHVRDHALFERDGSHLSCEVPVSFSMAVLGGELEVPTLDGHVKLKIPAETQSGRVLRLKEKGVKPVRGGPQGDLFCRVTVETPVNLTAEQRALVEKLDESLRQDSRRHNPREHTWLDGIRGFFDRIVR